MKLVYALAAVLLGVQLLLESDAQVAPAGPGPLPALVREAGVPNAVSAVIFRNRLYDTIFEVVVFTLAVAGIRFLLENEAPTPHVIAFPDDTSVLLARVGATVAALVAIELALRGHLSPGGGFAAGVAGGTAIGLWALTTSRERMERDYARWHAASLEKAAVVLFLLLAGFVLTGLELPHGTVGQQWSGGWMPLLNVLVAVKVALGAWAALLLCIRARGLL